MKAILKQILAGLLEELRWLKEVGAQAFLTPQRIPAPAQGSGRINQTFH